jgi:hypothetical protein
VAGNHHKPLAEWAHANKTVRSWIYDDDSETKWPCPALTRKPLAIQTRHALVQKLIIRTRPGAPC